MRTSQDGAQRASDLGALLLTAGLTLVTLIARPFNWQQQSTRVQAAQPVELSLEAQPETAPTPPPPAPPPPLKPREIATHAPVPVVPDPITFTTDPIPDDAAVVAANNPAPPPTPAPPARANADLEAQYAESLREDIDRRTRLPDSPQYRLHRVSGEVRVRFVLTRGGEARQVQIARSSGSSTLDQAAIAIVGAGHYAPMPTSIFVNQVEHLFAVTIDFTAAAQAARAH
jgi:TonB family protein